MAEGIQAITIDISLEDNSKKGSSFLHATFNSVNVMLGISFLSMPYALEKAGWLALSILFAFAITCCYTANALGHCLASNASYQKIAEAAFGRRARTAFTLLMYFELIAVLVGYTISLSDNLARLFPHADVKLWTIEIGPSKSLLILAFLIILPTVWLRDLTLMSYLSLAGIAIYAVIAFTLLYAGASDGIGFHHSVPLLRPRKLLHITGIYAYCFAAHCVFPSIHSSLEQPKDYPKVLIVSFLVTTATYTGFAFLGGTMFGEQAIMSQVSLNIPAYLTAAKIVLCLVILIPVSKYSLCIAPMALDIETRFPWSSSSKRFIFASIFLRAAIMVVIMVVAMAFPHFETMVAFIGSASGMLLAVILPCAFYLRLYGRSMSGWEISLNVFILILGLAVGTSGTIVSIIDFVHNE